MTVKYSCQGKKRGQLRYGIRASLVAQMVKNLPAMRDTWIRSLGQEDLLEKGMATHSSILTREIPWIEEPGRLQSIGLQTVVCSLATKQSQQTILV